MKEVLSREYRCEVCGETYQDEKVAEACEKQRAPVFNFPIGSWVIIRGQDVKMGRVVEEITVNKTHLPRYRVELEDSGEIENVSETCLVSFSTEELKKAKEEATRNRLPMSEDCSSLHDIC